VPFGQSSHCPLRLQPQFRQIGQFDSTGLILIYPVGFSCGVLRARLSRVEPLAGGFSFFVRARNLCAAHLLRIERRNREAGVVYEGPRGALPERLFPESDPISATQPSPSKHDSNERQKAGLAESRGKSPRK
jgi:hypothetical protein